ncbi:MAG: hypothetical protein AAF682_30475 [Planctomycetota bacterium]
MKCTAQLTIGWPRVEGELRAAELYSPDPVALAERVAGACRDAEGELSIHGLDELYRRRVDGARPLTTLVKELVGRDGDGEATLFLDAFT